MPEQSTTPNPSTVSRLMRAGGAGLLTAALCGGLALSVAAQTPAPSSASRARRAKAGAAKKEASASREKAAPDGGPLAQGAASAAGEASPSQDAGAKVSAEESPSAKDDVLVESKDSKLIESKDSKGKADEGVEVVVSMSGAADEGAEIEALRVRAASEADAAGRGRARLALAERLAASGRRAEAVELLREMLGEERLDPPYFYNTGNALARLGESGAAIEAYRKAAGQRRGNYARAQHNLGVVLIRLGRWEEAQEALTAALRLEHYTYAEASYNLGRLHALRGEAGLAMQEWARTLKIKPDHADAAVALARALAEDGDPEEGLAVLDAFSTRFARGGGVVAPREVSVARGEIVAARNVAPFERVEKVSSAERRAASSSSPSSSSPARESKAGARLRPLNIDRDSYSLLKRARAARESRRSEESVALYRRVLGATGGYFPPANLEMGYALADLGRDEEAVASLRSVAEKDGARYPIAFYHLGRYYERLGRFDESAAAFARAAALLGQESPQFLLDLSRVREKEGKWPESLAAAEAYVLAVERMGAAPDWAKERLERLRQKASPAPGSQK
jgi:tetratricopeptide (TPR) repeat protein